MSILAERDASLHNLQDKSSTLQGTSLSFTRQAKRLKWEMRWRQYRIMIFAAVFSVWLVLLYAFRQRLAVFLCASGIFFTVAYLLQRHFVKRWRAQLAADE